MKWATINHSRNQSEDEEGVTVYLVEMQGNWVLQTNSVKSDVEFRQVLFPDGPLKFRNQ